MFLPKDLQETRAVPVGITGVMEGINRPLAAEDAIFCSLSAGCRMTSCLTFCRATKLCYDVLSQDIVSGAAVSNSSGAASSGSIPSEDLTSGSVAWKMASVVPTSKEELTNGGYDMGDITGRIEALDARHAALEDQLAELLKRPSASTEEVAAIKKEKLEIKDELAQLERETAKA